MTKVTLGQTNIVSDKNGFGALPIQRISKPEAVKILHNAYDAGITYFDTARLYSDSEEKIGEAFSGIRKNIILATKTTANDADRFWQDLETSLTNLKTDYIDIYQFHTPNFCPKPEDGTGLYEAMLKAREQGKIRFIGITNHKLNVAEEAVRSHLYAALQFPFSYLATEKDIGLVTLCRENNIGFIAMKAMSGGLITRPDAAYAWLDQFENVLPIWGVQKQTELDNFIGYMKNPPALTTELKAIVEKDRRELAGKFCRGCGYCVPTCPQEIQINTCARFSLLARRAPRSQWFSEASQAMMEKAATCIDCGLCKTHCPYELDTPSLLKQNLADYFNIKSGKITA
jgi:predicted aldo/keto reductase-like oxidoreductase